MAEDFERFPRPEASYYEVRHEYVSQGDIFVDVPWSLMGPTILLIDPPPAALPVPPGHLPIVQYLSSYDLGMVVSDTCDFRHPTARDLDADPQRYAAPGAIYHSGYVRVAPVMAFEDYQDLPNDAGVRDRIRRYDHFRRLFYLPPGKAPGSTVDIPEAVALLHMTDLVSIDTLRSLERATQLTEVARKQLARKLVYFDTGRHIDHSTFTVDLQ